MVTKKTPPAYGLSDGPMMVACQWNISSATGPVDVPTQAHFSQTDQNSSLNASFETLGVTTIHPQHKELKEHATCNAITCLHAHSLDYRYHGALESSAVLFQWLTYRTRPTCQPRCN
jgi:hypothetical protein